jgi:hypothetical protein
VIQAMILVFVAAEQIIRWLYRIPKTREEPGQAPLSKGWGKS